MDTEEHKRICQLSRQPIKVQQKDPKVCQQRINEEKEVDHLLLKNLEDHDINVVAINKVNENFSRGVKLIKVHCGKG